jgi:uncharacterized membrane protein YjjB (DUF3815 family)
MWKLLIMMKILCSGSLVEVVVVAMLFNVHFTQMMGSLCHGVCAALHIHHRRSPMTKISRLSEVELK